MMIIYFHGFRSVGTSDKTRALVEAFGDDHVFSPDLPPDPKEVVEVVSNFLKENTEFPVLFLGTSLGGFYANYLASLTGSPAVLVNPCTNPSEVLHQVVGIPLPNHQTGEIITITAEHLASFADMEQVIADKPNSQVSLFVAENDATIDHTIALDTVPIDNERRVYETGGHRFTEHWGDVVEYIKELQKSS